MAWLRRYLSVATAASARFWMLAGSGAYKRSVQVFCPEVRLHSKNFLTSGFAFVNTKIQVNPVIGYPPGAAVFVMILRKSGGSDAPSAAKVVDWTEG